MFKKVGVLGAGQMGSGIAQLIATKNIPVILVDTNREALRRASSLMKKSLEKLEQKSILDSQSPHLILKRIELETNMEAFSDCDLIIEAVSEEISLKKNIFKQLSQITPPETLLTSNTSSISITELSLCTQNPSHTFGLHFMNPPVLMKLIELIPTEYSDKEKFEDLKNFSTFLDKTFVISQDRSGFIINRILMPMINEACYALYEKVATKEDIDLGMRLGTNQPIGPLRLADLIGLDVCVSILNVMKKGLKESKYTPCPLLLEHVQKKELGRKTKKGFYTY